MKKIKQSLLFKEPLEKKWEKEWKGMPEFVQKDLTPYKTIYVHFTCKKDIKKFAKLINQNITPQTKSVWYTKTKKHIKKIYVDKNET